MPYTFVRLCRIRVSVERAALCLLSSRARSTIALCRPLAPDVESCQAFGYINGVNPGLGIAPEASVGISSHLHHLWARSLSLSTPG